MYTPKKVRVLVTDDSLVFREAVVRGIGKDKNIEVIGTASDAFEARDKILELEPDVLTLDIEMPKMNGIEFLKKLIPQYPIPVVVVSALSNNVFEALDSGAVDFVTKPNSSASGTIEMFINELIVKIKVASMANISSLKSVYARDVYIRGNVANHDNVIIAIGASTGGTEALTKILKSFPKEMPGIVVVQHMPPVFTRMFSERLNLISNLEVKEAEHGDEIKPGRVLIAPGDYHMKVNKKSNSYYVECYEGEKINGYRPSVDVLFHSVAEKIGKNAIGVILTGMGYDGAKGLLKMKQQGAITLGQNEKTCVVYGMPKVAYDIGAVTEQIALEDIGKKILFLLTKK